MAFRVTCGGVEHWIDSLDNLTLNGATGLSKSANALVAGAGTTSVNLGDDRLSLDLTGTPPPPAPANVVATDGDFTDKVTITWDAAAGASTYSVYRGVTEDVADATLLEDSIAGLTTDDTTAVPGTVYHYWVTATNAVGEGAFSVADVGHISTGGGGPVDYINELFFRDATENPITLPWHLRSIDLEPPVLNLTTRAMEQTRNAAAIRETVAVHDAVLSGLNLSMTCDLTPAQWTLNNDIVCLLGRVNTYEFGVSWTEWKNRTSYYMGGVFAHAAANSFHARIYRKVLGSNYVLVTDTEAQTTCPTQITMTITGDNPVVINVYFNGVLKGTYSDSDATRINSGPYAGRMMVARAGAGVLGISRFGVAVT